MVQRSAGRTEPVAVTKLQERLLYRPIEAFELLGIGRSTGYALLASGALPSIKIGRSRRIPADSLKKWVEAQLENGDNF